MPGEKLSSENSQEKRETFSVGEELQYLEQEIRNGDTKGNEKGNESGDKTEKIWQESNATLREFYEKENTDDGDEDFLQNMIDLGIKETTVPKWGKITKEIRTFEDLNKIDENSLSDYLPLSDIPQENYAYIAENLKALLANHLQRNLGWRSPRNGGFSTGMNLKNTEESDDSMDQDVQAVENIKKENNIDKELDEIFNIDKKDNKAKDYLNLWIQRTLPGKPAEEQQAIFEKIFDRIPADFTFHSWDYYKKQPEAGSRRRYFDNEGKYNYILANKEFNLKTAYINYQIIKKSGLFKEDGNLNSDSQDFFMNFEKVTNLVVSAGTDIKPDLKITINNEEKDFFDCIKSIQDIALQFKIPPESLKGLSLNQVINFFPKIEKYHQEMQEIDNANNTRDNMAKEHPGVNIPRDAGYGISGNSPTDDYKNTLNEKRLDLINDLEESFAELLLSSKQPVPKESRGVTGLRVLDFSQSTKEDIVRNGLLEITEDEFYKFLDNLQNDRAQAGATLAGMGFGIFCGALGSRGGIAASAGAFTIGNRLGKGIFREVENAAKLGIEAAGRYTFQGRNSSQEFGKCFGSGVGRLDDNFNEVGVEKFFSGLAFDYAANVATFGLSKFTGGALAKIGTIKGIGGVLKFGMEELVFESFCVDIPMNILQTGAETYFGYGDGVITGQTVLGNKEGNRQGKYQAFNLNDMLQSMIDAGAQNLSYENLCQTFFSTVLYGGMLEGGGKAIGKIKEHYQVERIDEINTTTEEIKKKLADIQTFMDKNNIKIDNNGFSKDGQILPEKHELIQKITQFTQEMQTLEKKSAELIKKARDNFMHSPDEKTRTIFQLGLYSPYNTPLNILRSKRKSAEAELNNNPERKEELEQLLQEYDKAEALLKGEYFDGNKESRYGFTTEQAYANSQNMDKICEIEDISERNQKLQDLLQEGYHNLLINPQQEIGSVTFTPEQLQAIIDAHLQEGEFGNLTREQLIARRKILIKAGLTNPQIRFLLEGGFCGKVKSSKLDALQNQKESRFGISDFYPTLIRTEIMKDLNQKLTEKGEIFMDIASLSVEEYQNKITTGEIKFIFKDGSQQIQYTIKNTNGQSTEIFINENAFFSDAGKKEWRKMLENNNDQKKYDKFREICKKEGNRCFLSLIDFDYSQMSSEKMRALLSQGEKNIELTTQQKHYNQIFNSTVEYCCMEERMDPSFLLTYCKDLLVVDNAKSIVTAFQDCEMKREGYNKKLKDVTSQANTTVVKLKSLLQENGKMTAEETKDMIKKILQDLDSFIKLYEIKCPSLVKNEEVDLKAYISHAIEEIETKVDLINNYSPELEILFNITPEKLEAFFQNLKNQKFSDLDKNKMNFFLRTLFINAQIQYDPVFQGKYERSQLIKNHYLKKFGEENGLLLLGNTKSRMSAITKLSKDPGYPSIDLLNDIVRYTYQLESTGNEVADTQKLINLIGDFAETTMNKLQKEQPNPKPLIFNSKFKEIFDKDEKGNYLYIKDCEIIQDGNGNPLYSKITTLEGKYFFLKQTPNGGKTGKSASGKGYRDIKITYEINNTPFELKFMTSKRAENNEKGTSNHDVMRTIENINKTTRKYGLISDDFIQNRINKIWNGLKAKDNILQELYEDKALRCNENGDFPAFNAKNPDDIKKLKEKFTAFVFSKYLPIGKHNGHNFYVNEENIYLHEAYKDYIANQGEQGKNLPPTYIAFLKTLLENPDYFPGKISRFKISKEQAEKNSQLMDTFKGKNTFEQGYKFGDEIKKQYQRETGKKIVLTEEQLKVILETHQMEGTLGELTFSQLKAKIQNLSKVIYDANLRRFLLESGFCGSTNCAGYVKGILKPDEKVGIESIDEVLKTPGITVKTPKFQEILTGYDEENDIDLENRSTIEEKLFDDGKNQYGIVVIYDESKQSDHIALVDWEGNFYDQNGANGPIRGGGYIEDLLNEYKENLGGKAYYKVYALSQELQAQVKAQLGGNE